MSFSFPNGLRKEPMWFSERFSLLFLVVEKRLESTKEECLGGLGMLLFSRVWIVQSGGWVHAHPHPHFNHTVPRWWHAQGLA